jgi:site-specific recombinase XerD
VTHRHPDTLFPLVESFFRDYLGRVRNASRHSVLAYRDDLRLFFCYVADARGRAVAELRMEDLTVQQVLDFLDHLEASRHNAVTTRNLRLTVIRTFFRHLLRQDPSRGAQYQRILSLPYKKAPSPAIGYLEPEEVQLVLRQPERTANETRDHCLLLFLYNTGARISEALAVQHNDLQLAHPFQVHLHGKGRKERICPLWPETARILRRLVRQLPSPVDGPVFRSARGRPLSRDGAAYILAKHLESAARQLPVLRRRHITLHGLRHSCAVALLQAGVDLTVIRDYLGHQSIATTGRYTKTNLRMKRRVLDAFWRRAGLTRTRDPRWRPRADVVAFLNSL